MFTSAGGPWPLRILYNKFREGTFRIYHGYSPECRSWISVLYSLLHPVTLGYSLSHLGSLTSLAILSTAAPQASLSNSVNSGNSGFNSKVSQAGGDTSVTTVLIKFLYKIYTLECFCATKLQI